MKFLEIFSVLTGVIYLILQYRQKNLMWAFNLLCCLSAVVIFASGRLWVNAAINICYSGMSIWGIIQWKRDSGKVEEGEYHLRSLGRRTLILSIALGLAVGAGLYFILPVTGDAAPLLDAAIGALGVIGAWWLAMSYKENWIVWFISDALACILCIRQGLPWMAALYALYVAVSVQGFINWKKKGVYLKED